MTLTSSKVKAVRPQAKAFKIPDEKGLVLFVHPKGGKYWRLRYRWQGKEKTLALGTYPEVSLKEARTKRDKARIELAEGVDPSAAKQTAKTLEIIESQQDTFETLALDWYKRKQQPWSDGHRSRVQRLLKKDLLPYIGSRPSTEITPPELLAVLRRVEGRGAVNTAKRAKQLAGQIFRYGIATGKCSSDPSRDLTGAMAAEVKSHFAAVTEPEEVGRLLKILDTYQGSPIVRAALKLAPLTFVRPGELRNAQWEEINLEEGVWAIPPERMKMNQPHIVPLSTQAIAVLAELYPLTGRHNYVFISARSTKRPMSDNAVLAALRSLDIPKEKMCGHGVRAMARTILDEVLEYRIDWIETQLAHAVRDANGRAYNRTAYLKQRKKMMQHWADYLDSLKSEA